MNKQKKFDETTLAINPFTINFQIPVTKVISDITYELSNEDDDGDGVLLNKAFYVEKVKKTSIYHTESMKDNTVGLSGGALRLFTWIYLSIKPNKDYININKKLYMTKANIKSVNTYKKAVEDLIRYSYITGTQYPNVYFINPNMFFSGNRLKKFPQCISIKNTWEL